MNIPFFLVINAGFSYSARAGYSPSVFIILIGGVAILLIIASGWLWVSFQRRKRNQTREQRLKSYILQDPEMRSLYLESRKQGREEKDK